MLPSVVLPYLTVPMLLLATTLALPTSADSDLTVRQEAKQHLSIISGRSGKCIVPNPDRYGPRDGTAVVSMDCSLTPLTWELERGSGSIIMSDYPSMALDAGSDPENNGKLKVSSRLRWEDLRCFAHGAVGLDIVPGFVPADVSPPTSDHKSQTAEYFEADLHRWYWTDDNRIAITGGTQCLDEGDDGIQIYQCTTGNTNQSELRR
jgi:hypothetical protein